VEDWGLSSRGIADVVSGRVSFLDFVFPHPECDAAANSFIYLSPIFGVAFELAEALIPAVTAERNEHVSDIFFFNNAFCPS